MKSLSSLTAQDIEQKSLELHEPRWLREQRIFAWQQYEALPYPDWKKSKIPKIDLEQSIRTPFSSAVAKPSPRLKKPVADVAGELVIVDGEVLKLSLDRELASQGIIFCDMKTAVLERADLLERYIHNNNAPLTSAKMSALSAALWENGFFLFVPKGIIVQSPFRIRLVQKNPEQSVLSRSSIILDPFSTARVEVVLHSEKQGGTTIACSTTTEVFAEEAARLSFCTLQQWGEKVYDLSETRFAANKDAQITSLLTLLGAGAGNIVLRGRADHPGSRIEHNGILVAGDKQRFKITAEMDHGAEQTEGMMRYKGILGGEAYSYLDGLIRVQPQGQKANSRLEEHTLLLSSKSRCDALPALDIQTDDVKISHAAAVTQVDREKIFYLMSRGLSEEGAKRLLIEGFFEDILKVINDQPLYHTLKTSIEKKLFEKI